MKYHVNENCIGCGLCASLCPDLFKMNNHGTAEAVNKVVADDEGSVALENCPVSAIEQTEE